MRAHQVAEQQKFLKKHIIKYISCMCTYVHAHMVASAWQLYFILIQQAPKNSTAVMHDIMKTVPPHDKQTDFIATVVER